MLFAAPTSLHLCPMRRPIAVFATCDDLLARGCRQIGDNGPKRRSSTPHLWKVPPAPAAILTRRKTGPGVPSSISWSKGRTRGRVLADKACASKANRDALRGRHRDGIMRTAARHRPLRSSEKRFNLHRARYFGLAKTKPSTGASGIQAEPAGSRKQDHPQRANTGNRIRITRPSKPLCPM